MAADLVLLIDPSKTIHRMVESALTRDGMEVVTAGTAQAALDLLGQRQPELVLLECAMPALAETGVFAILAALTRSETGATLVLISADPGQAEATASKQGIVYASVLEKPFAAKALKVLVGKLSGQKTTPKAPASLPQATPPPLPPRTSHPAGPSALPASMPPPPPAAMRPRMTPSAASFLQGPPPAAVPNTDAVASGGTPPLPPPAPVVAPRTTPVAAPALAAPAPTAPPPIPAPVQTPVTPPAPAPAPAKTRGTVTVKAAPEPTPEPAPAPAAPAPSYEFDVPAALVSGREALVYLNHSKDTGVLKIVSEEETVQVYFKAGEVLFLSTDNPTIYLGDTTSPWKKTSANSLAAYEEQVKTGKPYIITLNQAEVRLTSNQLTTMVRRAGEEALVRALFVRNTRLRFRRLETLPEYVEQFAQTYSTLQLLLLSYRAVRGWETIEKEIAHSGVVVNFTRYFDSYADQLDLSDTEAKVIASVDGEKTVAEIAQATNCSTLEVGSVLYGFIRLGLITVTMIPDSNAIVSPM